MELETITVVMAVAGMVLLYGAVKNKNPLEVIKLALQGKDINSAPPLSTGSNPNAINIPNPFVRTVEGTAVAAPGVMHSNNTARFFPNNTPRYTDDPLAADLPAGDPRKRFRSGTTDPNGFVMAAKDATRAQGGYQIKSDANGNGGEAHTGYYNG